MAIPLVPRPAVILALLPRGREAIIVVVVPRIVQPVPRSAGRTPVRCLQNVVVVLLGSSLPPPRVLLEHPPTSRLVLSPPRLLVPLDPLLPGLGLGKGDGRINARAAHPAPR